MSTRRLMFAVTLGLGGCRPTTGVAPARRALADRAAQQAIAAETTFAHTPVDQRTIGVSPFAAEPTDTLIGPLAYALPDLLLGDLARSHSITIVDRVRLDALVRELHLASTNAIDTTTAPRVGRLLGAGRLVVGDLGWRAATDHDLIVGIRIADVSTGSVRTGFSVRAPLDQVFDAEKALAFRVFEELGVTLTPAEMEAIDRRPTRNLAALLAYGRGVRAEAVGDDATAAREYRRALTLDPDFQQAKTHLGAVQPAADVYPQLAHAVEATAHAINPSPLDPPPVSRPGGSVPPSMVSPPAPPVTVSVTVSATP